MDFGMSLRYVKNETERELARFFEEKKISANRVDNHVVPIVEQISDFTLRGGKRMRAFLCWLGYGSVKQTIQNSKFKIQNIKLFSAMMSLELFQSFALIHDDIIDQDTTRRGGRTVHEQFKVKSLKLKVKNARHFGVSMAILAGDLALAWVDELMDKAAMLSLRAERSNLNNDEIAASSRTMETPRNDISVREVYRHMKEEVIYGQSLDVLSQFGQATIPQNKINELKTAWYSVVRPLQIGAALAGGDQNHLNDLAAFGVPVGKLFQLKDDQMDGDVTMSVFRRESECLTVQSKEALGKISMSEQSGQLFSELITFVLMRTS